MDKDQEKEFDKQFKVWQSAFEQYGKVEMIMPTGTKETVIPIQHIKSWINKLLKEKDTQHAMEIAAIKSNQDQYVIVLKAKIQEMVSEASAGEYNEGFIKGLDNVLELLEEK